MCSMYINTTILPESTMQKHPRVLSSPKFTTPARAQKQMLLWKIMEEEIGEPVDSNL